MKLDRLIGILSILLQGNKVTMPYLAETFEVSRRTISRDIEALCRGASPSAPARELAAGCPSCPGAGWTGPCSPPGKCRLSWRG